MGVFDRDDNKFCDVWGITARSFILFLTIGGIVLQVVSMVECEFLEYSSLNLEGQLGLFKLQVAGTQECIRLEGDNTGTLLKTARVGAFLSPIFALIGMILVILEFCCVRICCSRVFESIMYWLAIIFGGLSFVIWGSDFCTTLGNCDMGIGAWLMVAGTAAHFVASLLVCCAPKPKPVLKRRRERRNQKEEEQQNVMADQDIGVYQDPDQEAGYEAKPYD